MSSRRHKDSTPVRALHHRVSALAGWATELRRRLADWALGTGLPPDTTDAVTLAAYEAMANVVVHAYPDHAGLLDLHASYDNHTVTVTDYGRWKPPPTEPGPLHGRGLPLIRGLPDHTIITPTANGTTVRMAWPLPDHLRHPSTAMPRTGG